MASWRGVEAIGGDSWHSCCSLGDCVASVNRRSGIVAEVEARRMRARHGYRIARVVVNSGDSLRQLHFSVIYAGAGARHRDNY